MGRRPRHLDARDLHEVARASFSPFSPTLAPTPRVQIENKVEEMIFKGELGNAEIPKFLDQNRTGKTYGQ